MHTHGTRHDWAVAAFVGAIVFIIGWAIFYRPERAMGSAPTGLSTSLAITNVISVGPGGAETGGSNTQIATSSPGCTSRVVTTYSRPIAISFGTSSLYALATSSLQQGMLQAASTTVSYDAGLYGCDFWTAYGYGPTTTITFSEFK